MRRLPIVVFVLFAMSFASPGYAAGYGHGQVSSAGGIVSSAAHTALTQNPAALPYNSGLGFELSTGSASSSFSDPFYGGALTYGRGGFGIGGGLERKSQAPNVMTARYGLGVYSSGLHTSFGVNGQTQVDPSGDSLFNAGILINPIGRQRLAFTARNFTASGGPTEYGAGIAWDLSVGATFLVDGTINKDFKHPAFKPALEIWGNGAALTVGYGFSLDDPFTSQELTKEFSVGASVDLTRSVVLKAYYKQIDYYDFSLVFHL